MNKNVTTIQEFQGLVSKALIDALESYEITIDSNVVPKNNGTTLHSLCIHVKDTELCPNIYVDEAFDAYQNGVPFQEIVSGTVSKVKEFLDNPSTLGFDSNTILDFNLAKDRIMMVVINTERNKDLLQTVPHREWEDLSIVYRVVAMQDGDAIGTALVTNHIFSRWNVTEDELFECAKKNIATLCPTSILKMDAIFRRMLKNLDMDDFERQMVECALSESDDATPMLVVTNDQQVNGAIAILCPGVTNMVAAILEDDLFVLPSSVHETIAIPATSMDPEEILAMVKEVNESAISPEEFLSDSIYYYDRASDTLSRYQD